jgi:hypothetical protein
MLSKSTMLSLAFSCVLSLSVPLHAQKCDGCSKNGIDMPISLAAGTVRTPEFAGKNKYYNIDIDAKWLLPADELRCRMGFAVSPSDNHCKWEPLLETKWRVLDEDRVVAEGYDKGRGGNFDADSHALTRNIGYFKGEAHHRYVVELIFMKDASVLNVTQPRLIVEPPGFSM